MALHVSNQNNVKIYTVASSSKTALPEWLAQAHKKRLRYDPNFSKRVELIQDFGFPEASIRLKATRDGQYLMATGVYKPQMRIYELDQAALKFERHTESENVQMEILSDDWRKSIYLQADRSIEFHTSNGLHYKTRIPKFGRDMVYDYPTCDILVGGAGNEIYRLNLDQGRFMKPLETQMSGVNVCAVNPAHHLWAFGGEDSCVEFWDPRSRNRLGRLNVGQSLISRYGGISDSFDEFPEVTALKFFGNGLNYAVGTKTGQVLLFDLRSSQPVLVKDHQYEFPIKRIEMHESTGNIISADSKVIKVWNKDSGKLFTSIEPESDINDLLTFKDSGLLMTANEGTHMNIFYCPALGPAPKWCSFLDNLTEEMEENQTNANMWDDYKFVSRPELSKLGLDHLVGTNVLKAYMHGFFIDLRLYEKARAVANPFEYEDYRKKLVKEKMEAEQQSRIAVTRKLPKVNRAVAEKLLLKSEKRGKGKQEEQETGKPTIDTTNPLGDSRFADMFTNPEFEIDEYDPEYIKFHTTTATNGVRKDPKTAISKSEFKAVEESEESELEGQASDDESVFGESNDSDDDQQLIPKKVREQQQEIKRQQKNISSQRQGDGEKKDLKMFELKSEESWEKLIEKNRKRGRGGVNRKRMTFSERLEKEVQVEDDKNGSFMKRGPSGAMAMTFKPKSRGSDRRGGGKPYSSQNSRRKF